MIYITYILSQITNILNYLSFFNVADLEIILNNLFINLISTIKSLLNEHIFYLNNYIYHTQTKELLMSLSWFGPHIWIIKNKALYNLNKDENDWMEISKDWDYAEFGIADEFDDKFIHQISDQIFKKIFNNYPQDKEMLLIPIIKISNDEKFELIPLASLIRFKKKNINEIIDIINICKHNYFNDVKDNKNIFSVILRYKIDSLQIIDLQEL